MENIVLLFIFSLGNCHPALWEKYNVEHPVYFQNEEYIAPAHFGEMFSIPSGPTYLQRSYTNNEQDYNSQRHSDIPALPNHQNMYGLLRDYDDAVKTDPRKPRMINSLGGFLSDGLLAGLNMFDKVVPPIEPQQSSRLMLKQEEPTNFTRSRRHEDNSTTQLNNTSAVITPLMQLQPVMEDKMETIKKPNELEQIVAQLNSALEFIKTHKPVVEIDDEPISNKTSTEDLVKYISATVETLMKTKNNATKAMQIKEISFALDILLNRIAKSAKEVIKLNPKNSTQTFNTENDDLMLRILRYVTIAKKDALAQKLQNGVEMNSQEIDDISGVAKRLRQIRQQDDDNINSLDGDVGKDVEEVTEKTSTPTTMKPLEVTARQEESEEQSSSEEGGGNLVANLLSSFLGSLSKPDGGVDVDAIVGLVGGLSVQKDDGSYDFSGLTELLQSFLGGDDSGGGSDVGAFLGGLLGAILQGSANPPGPQGTGKLTGNLVANILPGLSGPPPPTSSEEAAGGAPKGGLDSGSFLAGILSSMLGASSGTSSGKQQPMNGNGNGGSEQHGSAHGSASFLIGIKNGIFKSVISIITSLLTSSSGSSSSGSKGKQH